MSLLTRKELQKRLNRLGSQTTEANIAYHQWKIILDGWNNEDHKSTLIEHQLFWTTIEQALREKWTLGIQKIFDDTRGIDNLERLIEDCAFNKGLFHIVNIKAWMADCGLSESMIQNQLRDRIDPSQSDFDDLKASALEVSPTARQIIKNIRNNWLSHESSSWSIEVVSEQYKTLRRDDVEKILLRCWEVDFALSGALMRGDSLRIEDLPEHCRDLPEPWPMRFITNQVLSKASSL